MFIILPIQLQQIWCDVNEYIFIYNHSSTVAYDWAFFGNYQSIDTYISLWVSLMSISNRRWRRYWWGEWTTWPSPCRRQCCGASYCLQVGYWRYPRLNPDKTSICWKIWVYKYDPNPNCHILMPIQWVPYFPAYWCRVPF